MEMRDFNPTHLLAVMGAGVSLFALGLYVADLRRDAEGGVQGTPLGYLSYSEKDVRRRPRNRLLWVPLPKESVVFENDTIRTGPGSKARIELGPSGSVEMEGESLVVLETRNVELLFNVATGEIYLAGKVLARVGDSIVRSEGSVGVSRDGVTGSIQIRSQKNKVRIESGSGKVIELDAGNALVRTLSGKVTVKKFPLIRVEPDDGTTIDIKPGLPMRFRLQPVENAALDNQRIVVDVARDKDFRETLSTTYLRDPSEPLSLELGEGSYYWRARNPDSNEPLSTPGGFEAALPPRLAWAEGVQRFVAGVNDEGLTASFDWRRVRGARSYGLQFLRDDKALASAEARYTRLVWNRTRNEIWQKLRELPDDDKAPLKVRLTAFDGEGKTLSSPIEAPLDLQDGRRPRPPINLVAEVDADKASETQLRWKPAGSTAQAFEVELAGEKRRVEGLETQLPTEVIYKELSEGRGIRIRSLTAKGLAGNWVAFNGLETEKFALPELQRRSPRVLHPLDGSNMIHRGHDKLHLEWKALANKYYKPEAYEILLSKAGGGSDSFTAHGEAYEVAMPEAGRYRWKLRALWDKAGPGPWSEFNGFRIVGGAVMEAPVMRAPAAARSD